MKDASDAEEYERAARLRDDIKALERALEKQAVVLGDGTDCDVIALAEDQLEAAVQVFYVRGGRIRGQRGWVRGEGRGRHHRRAWSSTSSASSTASPPSRRRQRRHPARGPRPRAAAGRRDDDAVARRSGAAGRSSLRVPQRGDKKALAETVARNAKEALALHKTRRACDLTTRVQALHEIQEALGLADAPLRIECYDVSNLQGTHVVASMVVFEDGLARKSEYRRFSVKRRSTAPTTSRRSAR